MGLTLAKFVSEPPFEISVVVHAPSFCMRLVVSAPGLTMSS